MNFSLIMFNTAVLPFLADAGASGGDWISGQTLVAILSAIFGGTGLAYGGWKGRQARDEAARRRVEGAVDARVPQPLAVELKERFVTRREFDAHVAEQRGDLENIFARLSANDKNVGLMLGKLESIHEDLALIKSKLFRGAK